MPAYNRKQRRAAASAEPAEEETAFNPSSIPLAHAPEHTGEAPSKPEGKSLYDLAAEREAELFPGSKSATSASRSQETKYVNILPSGELSHGGPASDSKSSDATTSPSQRSSPEAGNPQVSKINAHGSDGEEGDYEIPPVPDTLLTSIPLCFLHFTLAFLAQHQFAQEIEVGSLLWDSAVVAFPSLTFMIHLVHGHIISFKTFEKFLWERGPPPNPRTFFSSVRWLTFPPAPRTLFYLPLAFCLGLKLIEITNDSGYYGVMKRAPSVGTLWVWCVLEMAPTAALLALVLPVGVGIFGKGYSFF